MTSRATIETARPRRWRRSIGCLLLAGVLSSCQVGLPPPLLSPLQATGEYGYADAPLGDGSYQVSYVGPGQRSLRSPEARAQVTEAERAQAYDLALWRAAEIALAQGFVGFRVSNVRTEVDSIADEDYDPFYGPRFFSGHRFGQQMGSYGAGTYLGPTPYLYTYTRVVIDVALLRSLDSGDLDAKETIARLSKAYPGATGPATRPAG